MRTGLLRSLGVQLSDGSLASAHRSTGQTSNHSRPCCCIHSAACFAKYVNIISAPALFMAVRTSRAASVSTSHPFAAAAFSIAYSPLVW
jgi:hypothetical protein